MGELKIQVGEMFEKYGLTKEVLDLSQQLDLYIVTEQRERLNNGNNVSNSNSKRYNK